MTPEALVTLLAGVVGACVGSFLNVCVYRWPEELSVVSPPSRCPHCGNRIRWYDNVPVLGWLWLRGRCRDCRAPVSIQYPLIELLTGVIWAVAVLRFGVSWPALASALFLTILLGIALTDARAYIIPDEFSVGGLVLGLLLSVAPGGITPVRSLLGAAVGFAVLWLVGALGKAVFRKEAMGGGDIKMLAMIGAFLGIQGVLLTLFLGAFFGSVVFGPISLRTGKLVPFGIFLALGAAVAEPWGDAIVRWYLRTFVPG